MTRY